MIKWNDESDAKYHNSFSNCFMKVTSLDNDVAYGRSKNEILCHLKIEV